MQYERGRHKWPRYIVMVRSVAFPEFLHNWLVPCTALAESLSPGFLHNAFQGATGSDAHTGKSEDHPHLQHALQPARNNTVIAVTECLCNFDVSLVLPLATLHTMRQPSLHRFCHCCVNNSSLVLETCRVYDNLDSPATLCRSGGFWLQAVLGWHLHRFGH